MRNNIVRVKLWHQEVGSLYWDERRKRSVFSYHPSFLNKGLDIAPLSASIKEPRNRLPIYGLPNDDVFCGLPAFIADSLPGRWGNAVFDAWAIENHVRPSEITSVDKLSFIGKRGMGALEFEPAQEFDHSRHFQLAELYKKALEILQGREEVTVAGEDLTLCALYEVGTSAGGNHSKAVIAINKETGDIRSGQVILPEGYRYYLLKFAETRHYPLTRVEMTYADRAKAAGITMTTALISVLSHRKVRGNVAMTGEVTLQGRVLPIGGLKEKSMAAYREGIKTVIIPFDNQSDLQDVDEKVKSEVKFIPVKNIDQAIRVNLVQ